MEDISTRLLQLVSIYQKDVSQLSITNRLKEDLQLDSLSMTELIVACEDEFNIEIDADDQNILKVVTVEDLAKYIQNSINQTV
jgi:acyl carrier protein